MGRKISYLLVSLIAMIVAPVLAVSEPSPINESKSGVNPDSFWALFIEEGNVEQAIYGGADYRASAAG